MCEVDHTVVKYFLEYGVIVGITLLLSENIFYFLVYNFYSHGTKDPENLCLEQPFKSIYIL